MPNARALQILILAISLVVVLTAGLCTGQLPSAPVDLEMGHHSAPLSVRSETTRNHLHDSDLEAPLDLEIGLGVVPPASTDNARSDLGAPVDAALGSLPPGIVPSFLLPAEITQLREQRRFMTQWAWTETFEQAYLGTVGEGEMLAGGFGGTVRTGVWRFAVVTKAMHRDAKSEELFKQVSLGLLSSSSPYLGFASNVFGELRLVSACLPHGVGDLLLSGLGIIDRLALAKGMVKAVSCMTQLDLVHCDLKPDNFMLLSHDRTVFVIDFGSVSRPGDLPPMSCQHYCPPDTSVSLAFDVFSLGRVFREALFTNNSDVPDQVALLIDHMTQDEPRHRPDLQDCLERLVMIEAAVQKFQPGSV